MSNSLWPHGLHSPWNSSGWNTGVGSLSLLKGIFPTQGENLGLPHCRWIPYQLNHQGSPRILEWVAYPFSRVSPWPRNGTWVSCIAGRFFSRCSWQKKTQQKNFFHIHLMTLECEINCDMSRCLLTFLIVPVLITRHVLQGLLWLVNLT